MAVRYIIFFQNNGADLLKYTAKNASFAVVDFFNLIDS